MSLRPLRLSFLTFLILTTATIGLMTADEPKKADETGLLVVTDSAGKEHKLKTWKFTTGIRHLSWLVPAAPAENDPDEKSPRPAPKGRPLARGPEALTVREDNSTVWANGVQTLVPLDRIRSVAFDAEKETIAVQVAVADKPENDLTLTGTTKFQGINKVGIDAEVDKGELGVAEVRFQGGVAKGGIRNVRFPMPKAEAEVKDARPAAITYGDKHGKHIVNVTDLQSLYRTADGEILSGLLFFKKTVKIDVAKLKKLVANKEEGAEPAWGVTLKSGGDEEMLTMMTTVQLDGKSAQLEGLLGRVPAGYKLFPVHLLHEIEFDTKKDEGAVKGKPD